MRLGLILCKSDKMQIVFNRFIATFQFFFKNCKFYQFVLNVISVFNFAFSKREKIGHYIKYASIRVSENPYSRIFYVVSAVEKTITKGHLHHD